jgi:septum formation protein
MIHNLKIVLCSASPRRQQLLREAGISFEILAGDVNEDFSAELKAENVALFLAEKKADAFKPEFQNGKIYITADTIVWLKNEVLGKPVNAEDAFTMLRKLSGHEHQVYTGVCISSMSGRELFYVRSDVRFKNLSDEEIKFYVEHYKPFDKAGAYGAQECLPEGINPCSGKEKEFLRTINKNDLFEKTVMKDKKHMPIIENISGSYFNVMGLPLVELYTELQRWDESPRSKVNSPQ